ncbi:unnamed protein product [Boreogadus saida]
MTCLTQPEPSPPQVNSGLGCGGAATTKPERQSPWVTQSGQPITSPLRSLQMEAIVPPAGLSYRQVAMVRLDLCLCSVENIKPKRQPREAVVDKGSGGWGVKSGAHRQNSWWIVKLEDQPWLSGTQTLEAGDLEHHGGGDQGWMVLVLVDWCCLSTACGEEDSCSPSPSIGPQKKVQRGTMSWASTQHSASSEYVFHKLQLRRERQAVWEGMQSCGDSTVSLAGHQLLRGHSSSLTSNATSTQQAQQQQGSEEFGGRGSVHVVPVDLLPLGVLVSSWRTGFLGRQSFVFLKQGDLVSDATCRVAYQTTCADAQSSVVVYLCVMHGSSDDAHRYFKVELDDDTEDAYRTSERLVLLSVCGSRETVGWDISLDKFAKHLRTEQQRALGVLLVSHHEEGSNNDHIQCGVPLMSD